MTLNRDASPAKRRDVDVFYTEVICVQRLLQKSTGITSQLEGLKVSFQVLLVKDTILSDRIARVAKH